jgi:hypothetical protein
MRERYFECEWPWLVCEGYGRYGAERAAVHQSRVLDKQSQIILVHLGIMPSFLPDNELTLPSKTERHEGKRGRRTLSGPTPMDVDSEEGSQIRCSFCNGNRLS